MAEGTAVLRRNRPGTKAKVSMSFLWVQLYLFLSTTFIVDTCFRKTRSLNFITLAFLGNLVAERLQERPSSVSTDS